MIRHPKFQATSAFITLFLLFSSLIYFWSEVFLTPRAIEFKNIHVTNSEGEVIREAPRGSVVWLTRWVCSHDEKRVEVIRGLKGVNKIDISLQSIYSRVPQGCTKITSGLIIPLETPNGLYQITTNVKFQINAFGGFSVIEAPQAQIYIK